MRLLLPLLLLALAACSDPAPADTGEVLRPERPSSYLVVEVQDGGGDAIVMRDLATSFEQRIAAGGIVGASVRVEPGGRLHISAPGADQAELDHIAKLIGLAAEVSVH